MSLERLELTRHSYDPRGTLGRLWYPTGRYDWFQGGFFHTVERPWLDNAPNISCIPQNTYICKRVNSPRFGNTFEVTNVPNRTHILIHAANFPHELQGCIAVGTELMADKVAVASSRKALNKLYEELANIDEFELEIKQLIV